MTPPKYSQSTSNYTAQILDSIHKSSFGNHEIIINSKNCGCFHCCQIFSPQLVVTWTQEPSDTKTGWCPKCNVDSLIGDAGGPGITNELLIAMYDKFF